MTVPFIDILRFEEGFLAAVTESTANLLRTGQYVGGPSVQKFEAELSKYAGVEHAIGCANGTDAIQLALRAANIGKGDVVLLPDMTFWATFEAVVNVGATPVTIDVSKDNLHVSLETVQEAIDRFSPKSMLLVHLYGWACPDTIAIRELCRKNNVVLIEDCAQALATKINGESLIAGALMATTSFYPAKVLGASGDAGAVFTNDANLAKRTRQLLNHGRTDHYEHGLVGWNSRLGAYEANFLNYALIHLNDRILSRRKTCERYANEISNPILKILKPGAAVWENGYLSVGMTTPESRPGFIEYLKAKNIGYGTVYPGAMSEQSGAKSELGGKISLGHSDWIAKSVINLPCFAYMTDAEVDYVIQTVNQAPLN